ncbi:uncharacterized protein MELLADRAFT_87937 [Melampsora larici-populina 98AG31]|uniref:Poly(A) polymerase nucleotidyltransferase domain-containing protein n=1 Tax=Melampsora larici-populina (strain 98AG31 / pathotype 3-4-7) TaxID=747676 RepID=F4SE16_MELLP|nr:uncharacterized protein MELLADRAFT_87937 [Melampsora larici-populina 98AG31]EGF97110.1 hypothetical protein MELLADRAFT_87937 [Melampsora larici-populina 98AG31]
MMSLPPNGLLPKTYGVTGPISINGPTCPEGFSTTVLMDELKARCTFESPEDARAREFVLGRLNLLVKEFVIKVSPALGMSDHVARETGGNIFTFGQFKPKPYIMS